ncbi:MAG: membrane protein insertion efficiency factor YidD [Oscillospiraceae bacterium]|nr:membrane protein insertion efficiency factor YidD [Oscillospiraceae bacterium]
MVETYQAVAPAKTRERCRYEPSCSVYMLQALKKYGFLPGLKKGLKRWRSCKPPNGGIDPP